MDYRCGRTWSGTLAGLAGLAVCAAASGQATIRGERPERVVIDGVFEEWIGTGAAINDPLGDADGAFDLGEVKLASAGGKLFVLFETNAPEHNLQSGRPQDGSVVLTVVDEEGDELTVDTRAKRVTLVRDGSAQAGNWTLAGYTALPTFAAERYEMVVDLAPLDVEDGDVVRVSFSGSDATATVRTRVRMAEPEEVVTPADRAVGTDHRLFVLNTLRNGLTNPGRAPIIGRKLRAAQPDVLLLQEEWQTSPGAAKAALDVLYPLEGGGSWNVVKNDGCFVASPLPLIELPTSNNRYAAAIVAPVDEPHRAFVAVSVHFKCCGSAGSNEDVQRVEQAREIATLIAALRAAGDDSPVAEYRDAPVVVGGDWNLVGSRAPLDVLTSPDGADLEPVQLLDLVNRSAVTWVNESSDFSPGRLDLVAVSDDATPLKSFVLNTRTLPAEAAADLGLEGDDSRRASDHLPLVIDVALTRGKIASEGGEGGDGPAPSSTN